MRFGSWRVARGALADRTGWFELADNGTLLLDEVGGMPLNQQAKLLRAIDESAVVPVGAANPAVVNVRVVAATNADLHEAEGTHARPLGQNIRKGVVRACGSGVDATQKARRGGRRQSAAPFGQSERATA